MIYLDSAATSFLKPPCVAQAVYAAMNTMGSPGRGAYPLALDAGRCVWRCRQAIARLMGCEDASRVVFTSGVTEALNLVLWGLLNPGDHVISTDAEHNSVLRPLYALQKQGVQVDFLPADEKGLIDWAKLPRLLRPNTRAVVTTHASNVTGNLHDIDAIGSFCRAHDLLFILDAAQTAGARPIDMKKSGVSVLCFAGHKSLMGPQGMGGFCLAPGVEPRTWKTGGSGVESYRETMPQALPERLEAGTLNAHGAAGLLAAVEYIQEQGVENIHRREQQLYKRFLSQVRQLPGVCLYGDVDAADKAPVLLLNLRQWDAAELSDVLSSEYDICTRSGAHCAPRMHRALGTDKTGAVRFSFSSRNNEQEIDTAVRALAELSAEKAESHENQNAENGVGL